MQVDTMRLIDYYVGVPLTFILTIVRYILDFVMRPNYSFKSKNVLFIELSEMGSAILVDPVIRYFVKQYSIEPYFVIFDKNEPSLRILNTVSPANTFTIRSENFFILAIDTIKFVLWCRFKKIDTVVDLELFSRYTAILSYLSGARKRVGFYKFTSEGLYRGDLYTHNVMYNPYLHITKNFYSLVYAVMYEVSYDSSVNNSSDCMKLGEVPFSKTIVPDDVMKITKVCYTEDELDVMRRRVKAVFREIDFRKDKLVIINPNASELLPLRRWPKEYYIDLIRMILLNHENVYILLTGAKSEYNDIQEIVESFNGQVISRRVFNFAGMTDLTDLPLLYSIASFMVTNDSGPAHFAAVTDLPTYVLFGPETPVLYRSLGNTTPIYLGLACSPCVSAYNHRKSPCTNNKCLKQIKPDIVYKIILKQLQR